MKVSHSGSSTPTKMMTPSLKRSLSMESTSPSFGEFMESSLKLDSKQFDCSSGSEQDKDDVDPYATDDAGSDYVPSSPESSAPPSISPDEERELASALFDEPEPEQEIKTVVELVPLSADPLLAEQPAAISPVPGCSETRVQRVRLGIRKFSRLSSVCLFCKRHYVRLSRHLERIHRNHPQVAAIMAMSNIRDRKAAWRKLRLDGNYQYNCDVLQGHPGNILVQRNPRGTLNCQNYLVCQHCNGFYKKTTLYKHVRRCNVLHRKYDRVQTSSRLALPEAVANRLYNKDGIRILTTVVYPKMISDVVTETAQKDEIIVRFAADYCTVNMSDPDKSYMAKNCSQKMRELGRLLLTIRKMYGSATTLRDVLLPER